MINPTIQTGRQAAVDYWQLSLSDLVRRVTEQTDRQALAQLHERRVFAWPEREPLRLAEFLGLLRERLQSRPGIRGHPLAAEMAYDLTLSKFSSLPPAEALNPGSLKPKAIDCRYYYIAYLDALARATAGRTVHPLPREGLEARTLQNLVVRHFDLSFREALRRGRKQWQPVRWSLAGGTLKVWMPRFLTYRQRLAWLRANIEDPDAGRPGERQRVQEIINGHFLGAETLSYEEFQDDRRGCSASETNGLSYDLAEAVVVEKVKNIHRQRPAIAALGPGQLAALIRTVFAELTAGPYDEGKLARSYGLSKATFSRFAGSRWHRDGPYHRIARTAVPDLWRNTAKALAASPQFAELARDSGVWDPVCAILKAARRPPGVSHAQ